MDYYKLIKRIFILFLCFFIIIVQLNIVNGKEEGKVNEEFVVEEKKPALMDMVKSFLSLSTRFPVTKDYWVKVKTLINQAQTYISPPNLDFRRGEESEIKGEGTKEKVKEAVVKSLDKSKATIEGSAKSAAKIAGETAKKVKERLSEKGDVVGDDEAEL